MDWEAFATSFLRDTAGYINQRKDKADEYREKLKETADRNKSKLAQLRQAAKAQQGFIAQAKSLYATPAQIEAALDSGATGVRDLVTKLQGWKDDYGAAYTADLVKDKIALPEGFQPTGNIDPMSRYGLKDYIVGDVQKPKGSWWDKALGLDAQDRVRAELDSEQFGGTGLSTYDLAQISDIAGYTSLNPSSFVTYTEPNILSTKGLPKEIENLQDAATAAQAEAKRIYDEAMAAIDATEYPADTGVADRRAAKQKVAQDRIDYIKKALEPLIAAKRSIYSNYDEMMADTLRLYGIEPIKASDGTGDGVVTGGGTGIQPLMDSGITETELPPATQINNKLGDISIKDPETGEEQKLGIIKTDDGFQIIGPDGDLLSPEESKKVIEATKIVTMEQLEKSYPGPATPEVASEDVTAQQMNESLSKPFTAGDPRPSDGMFASPSEKYRAKVWDALYGKTHNPDGTLKNAAPEQVQTEGGSSALLKEHGNDILKYMDDAGVIADDSDEEIKAAIADWYNDNAERLNVPPLDDASMQDTIYAIRLYLKEK